VAGNDNCGGFRQARRNCQSEAMTSSASSSYAAAANAYVQDHQHVNQELYSSPPTSMTLLAALFLLDNPLYTKTVFNKVFLLSKGYLQNWLTWAYHQPVLPAEIRRLQLAVRLAAESLSLPVPKLNDPFQDPGPIDATSLSHDDSPLVLRDNVVVWDGTQQEGGGITLSCAVPERFYEVLIV
jgi:hypothetical protein